MRFCGNATREDFPCELRGIVIDVVDEDMDLEQCVIPGVKESHWLWQGEAVLGGFDEQSVVVLGLTV